MSLDWFTSLIFFCIVLLGTPGPAVIALLASGVQHGFVRTMPFFSGLISGFSINLISSSLFLSGAFYLSKNSLFILKTLALIYMLYIAYKIAVSGNIKENTLSKPMNYLQGLTLNLINPKAYVAAFSSLSIFALPDNFAMSIVVIILANIIIALICQSLWVLLGHKLSRFFKDSGYNRVINIVLGSIMVLVVVFGFFLND